ncbi:hypothetical protein [Rhodopirellula europaea]|uniref:hypothetical protein n=1 Tax=Rhodopirellula europaea TaxID=1263866 RepID=UPI003D2D21FA
MKEMLLHALIRFMAPAWFGAALLIGTPSVYADLTTAVDLINARLERDTYTGIKITYSVSYLDCADGWPLEHYGETIMYGTRVLEVGNFSEDMTGIPFRLTHLVENPGEAYDRTPQLVRYFESFDGEKSQIFARNLFYDQCEKVAYEHNGYLDAGATVRVIRFDPIFQALYAGSNVGNQLVGSATRDPLKPTDRYGFTVTEKDGFPLAYKIELGDRWSLFSPEPELLVLDSNEAQRLVTKEVSYFVDKQFPKIGIYRSPSWSCEFEILNVVEASQQEGHQWFMDWPEGTTVVDGIGGGTDRVPFSSKSLSEIQRQVATNCGSVPVNSGRNWLLALNLILLISIPVVIVIGRLWRLRKMGSVS